MLETDEGWAKYNRHYWKRDYPGFLEFFFSQCFVEPHSTKQIEDCVGWGLETTPEVLLAIEDAPEPVAVNVSLRGEEQHVRELAGRVQCPVMVIHGDADAITPHARGVALAEMTGGRLVTLKGSGHIPLARDPVKVNLLLRDFIEETRRSAATAAAAQADSASRAAPRRSDLDAGAQSPQTARALYLLAYWPGSRAA